MLFEAFALSALLLLSLLGLAAQRGRLRRARS